MAMLIIVEIDASTIPVNGIAVSDNRRALFDAYVVNKKITGFDAVDTLEKRTMYILYADLTALNEYKADLAALPGTTYVDGVVVLSTTEREATVEEVDALSFV